ncbi:hypothetical protein K502DRAFT_368735 [Neoconidiobolus thromboides FSU 785]|nr:hypothetical protein K502DRAFT_368735 [Neoconidiobolus thromboides FSU 785]
MIDEFNYLITSPALANLLAETSTSKGEGMEGFLFGIQDLDSHKNITDNSDELKFKKILNSMIKGYIKFNQQQRLFLMDIDGNCEENILKQILKEEQKNLVGYFYFTDNEEEPLLPSLRLQRFISSLIKLNLNNDNNGMEKPMLILAMNGTKKDNEYSIHQTKFKLFSIFNDLSCNIAKLKILNLTDFNPQLKNEANEDLNEIDKLNFTNLIAPSSITYNKSIKQKIEKPNVNKLISTHNELFKVAYEEFKDLLSTYLLGFSTSATTTSPPILRSSSIKSPPFNSTLLIPEKLENNQEQVNEIQLNKKDTANNSKNDLFKFDSL